MHIPSLTLLAALIVGNAHASIPDQTPFFAPYRNSTPAVLSVPPDQWAALNTSVHGRLLPGIPFAKPCFSRYDGQSVRVEEEECTFVRQNYRNESVRTSASSGQINPQWETCQATSQSCLLDHTQPFDPDSTQPPRECHLGSVSNYYIDVREPSDVAAAFTFSRSTSVPLVIKNTGHDYKGRSSAPHSLGLWTHNLQEMTYTPSFVPTGCSSSEVKPRTAATLGAGVQWFEAYAFAQEHNITLVGGADRTVGTTGGWLQGGGHGALTNTMGMGADRVIEFTVVTPDGSTRIANQCQNQDLFFALRGGGGGTFGVVLSATTLASPSTTIQAVLIQFPLPSAFSPDSLTHTKALFSILISHALQWAAEGWGAYINANSALYLNPVISKEQAKESMRPLVEFGEGLKKEMGKEAVVVQGEYDSWAHFYNIFADGNSADLGEPLALASRLIPSSVFDSPSGRDALLNALLDAQRIAPGLRILKTTPFNYAGDGTTAVNSAWREAVFHVTVVAPWNWNATREEVSGQYELVGRAIGGVRHITEWYGGGVGAAYVNEADVHEPDHEKTFWGAHYPRLLEIKNKYDPDHLLDCWHCVGWNAESARYSCYI